MVVKKSSKKNSSLSVDFSETESRKLVPEGDYEVEVVKVEQKEGTKAPYLNWELRISTGKYSGQKLWDITSLSPSSLWRLRATLEAMGYEIPEGRFNLDLDSLKGLTFGVSVELEKYQGKNKSKVTDVFALETDEDEEYEEEEEDEESEEEEGEDSEESEEESDEEEEESDEEEGEEEEEAEEEPPKRKGRGNK